MRLPYEDVTSFKIALIMQSRSSLPLYRDLDRMSDRELEEQVLGRCAACVGTRAR